MKKVGKTIRPFRYDENQIPYDFTAKVTNRLKGLDLTDRVHEEQRTEVYNMVLKVETKNIPPDRNATRQNCCLRRLYK